MHRQLALAACGFLCATTASAMDLPARKPGLWEMKMIFEGRSLPPQTMQHCTDASTDKLMNASFGGMTKDACSKNDMKVAGDTITIDSVCKFGDATTTSHAVITGRFDQAYTVKMTSTQSGGRPMPGVTPGQATQMTIEAKWLGACKPGQKPGDIIMSNGMKMNVTEMPAIPGRPPQ